MTLEEIASDYDPKDGECHQKLEEGKCYTNYPSIWLRNGIIYKTRNGSSRIFLLNIGKLRFVLYVWTHPDRY